MYVRVYSLEGEAFDVTRHVADDLILQKGWTQTPPTFIKKEEPEPKAKPKAKRKKKKVSIIARDKDDIAATLDAASAAGWPSSDE